MEEFEDLLENVQALILLCYLGEKLTIKGLPNFIDSGKACDWLYEQDYVKKRTSKHVHNRPCVISKSGYRILNRLENRGIIDILNKCRFETRELLFTDFYSLLEEIKTPQALQIIYPSNPLFSNFPRMQKWNPSKIGLKYRIIECIELGEEHFELRIDIVCPNCGKSGEYLYRITDLNQYWSRHELFGCSHCSKNYEHNFFVSYWREANDG